MSCQKKEEKTFFILYIFRSSDGKIIKGKFLLTTDIRKQAKNEKFNPKVKQTMLSL
jgi:hypothetical protein